MLIVSYNIYFEIIQFTVLNKKQKIKIKGI